MAVTELDPEEADPDEVYFKCPNGHLGRIDEGQLTGEVSIICEGNYADCDFHGYINDGELVRRGDDGGH